MTSGSQKIVGPEITNVTYVPGKRNQILGCIMSIISRISIVFEGLLSRVLTTALPMMKLQRCDVFHFA